MISVILGGTSNLGKFVSERLENLGYKTITVSRSSIGLREDSDHFQCDLSDNIKLVKTLNQIKRENNSIDNLWCIAGYAQPTRVEDQTSEVRIEHLNRNLTYVQTSLEILKDNLAKSRNPFVVTLGSQWSYRSPEDCPELTPYANAKKSLMKYTEEFTLTNPLIRANHYCIPSTNTGTYREIVKTLRQVINKELLLSHGKPADPQVVAESLVEHAIKSNATMKTFLIDLIGRVEVLSK